MHVPPHVRMDDLAELHQVMRAVPLATLVTATAFRRVQPRLGKVRPVVCRGMTHDR